MVQRTLLSGAITRGQVRDSKGEPFYGAYEARELAKQYATEVGIEVVPSAELAYVPGRGGYAGLDEVKAEEETESISGTEFSAAAVCGGRDTGVVFFSGKYC
jgi:ATP sulfurylase